MAANFLMDRARLHHAYILSAPTREESLDMAVLLARAALCPQPGIYPCGQCRDCRKIQQGIHPDVVYVRCLTDDKGKEKKEIGVDQIRQLVMDASILPNEAVRKLFIVDQAEKMNPAAQNAALKLLEEPPAHLILALCTSNPQGLLSTVRSRCAEVNGAETTLAADGESIKLAEEYLRCVAKGDAWELCCFCFAHEGMDSSRLKDFLQALQALCADMLCNRRDTLGLSSVRLMRLCELAQRCESYQKVNTGGKHIFGLLAVLPAEEG